MGDSIMSGPEKPEARILLFRMLQYLYKFYVQGCDRKSESKGVSPRYVLLIFHLEHNADQLPDLTESEDIFNVLALCMYCILSNVLDSRTYSFPDQSPQELDILLQQRMQYDYNALSPVDRRTFSYYRGLALNLISWISCHYLGFDSEGDGEDMETISALASVYLQRLASGLPPVLPI